MPCSPEIPCSIIHTAEMQKHFDRVVPPDDGQCRLCCGSMTHPAPCTMYFSPGKTDIPVEGHGTIVTPLRAHGSLPQDLESAVGVIRLARSLSLNDPLLGTRGHFVLRNYAGHWGLELFFARQTVPHPLAISINQTVDRAARWFFDPTYWLHNIGDGALAVDPTHGQPPIEEPLPARRHISADEISERIAAYQVWLDREELRMQLSGLLLIPPLVELPPELQRRLVYHFDRLWFDWLDMHPDYRWTPNLGFWKREEIIFPLVEGVKIPQGELLEFEENEETPISGGPLFLPPKE